MRVDNQDSWLQKKLDNGEIMHPSIEGRPHPISGRYHFTGLALLEKGVELPGMPTTQIVPLVFNESVGKSICEFKGGKMVCECETKTSEVKNNLKTSIIKEAIKEALLEQQPRTDAERAKAHFNISDEEWDKLSDKEKQAYIDKLPPRGTAGQEAEWNPTADWPDSCFMHVPDSAKGENGNKSDRKLPYKYPSGKIDCPHVLAIIQTLQGARGGADIPENLAKEYLSRAQNLYKQNCNPDYEPEEMKEQEVPDATNAPSTVANDDTATCPKGQHWDSDANKCVDDVMQECDQGWHFDSALQKCIPDNPQVNENALRTARAELKVIDMQEKYEDAMETIDNLNRKIVKLNAEVKIERENHIGTKCTLEGRNSELDKRLKIETQRADKAHEQQMKVGEQNVSLMKDNDALRKDNEAKTVTIEKQKTQIDNLTRQHTETFAENTRLSGELTDALNREIQWNKDKQNLQEGLAKALKHQKYVYEFLKSKGFEIVKET